MRYREVAPSAPLALFVKCYWFLSGGEPPTDKEPQPILPDGSMELVINLGSAFRRLVSGAWQRQPLSMIVGQTGGPVVVEPTGLVDMIGVRFHPWGARAFLNEPLALLRDQIPALDDISSKLGRLLADYDSELRESRRISALERMLLRALHGNHRAGDGVEHAARLMVVSRGTMTVSTIAREANLSRRQLERRFDADVGVSPKRLSRILRFQNALRLSQGQTSRNWAAIATGCGYFDQAHLIRDFQEFAGHTPASLALDETSLTFLAVESESSGAPKPESDHS